MSDNPYADFLAKPAAAPAAPAAAPATPNPYADFLARDAELQDQQSRLRASAIVGRDTNPDQYAQSKRMADEAGLPPQVVDRNRSDVERSLYLDRMDRLAARSPATAVALTNPETMKLAHDDVEALSRVESFGQGWLNLARVAGAAVTSTNAALWRVLQFGMETAGASSGQTAENNPIVRWVADQARGQEATTKEVAPAMNTFAERMVYGGLQSAGQSLMTLPFGSAMVAAGVAGLNAGGSAYGEAREKGLAPAVAAARAVPDAVAEVITEHLPAARLFEDMAKGVGLGKLVKHQLTSELRGESYATLIQNFNEWATQNPDKTVGQFLKEQPNALLETAIQTVITAGAVGAVGHTVAQTSQMLAERRNRAATAAQAARANAQAIDAAAASKLRERDPAAFEAFASDATGNAQVYVDGAVLAQSVSALPPEQQAALNQRMPGLAAQLQESALTGADVQLPMAAVMTHFTGTPLAQTVVEHGRVDPDAPSATDAAEYQKRERELFQAADAQAQAETAGGQHIEQSADTVRQNIMGQLAATGRFTEETNRAYAELPTAFYTTMAAKLGITPDEMARRYPLRIVAEAPTDAGRFDQGSFADDPKRWEQRTAEHKPGEIVSNEPDHRVEYVAADSANPYAMPAFVALDPAGNVIGRLNVLRSENTGVGAVEVDPQYRRKGIATSLYSAAERRLGITMRPEASQSADAKAFWAQPDRPFGKSTDPSVLHQSGTDQYAAQIDALLAGTVTTPATLGMPSPALRAAGIPGKPLRITKAVVEKLQENHLTTATIKDLPRLLAEPVFVFKSDTRDGRYVVVTDANDQNGDPIIVAVDPTGQVENVPANIVASAYGKSNAGGAIDRWTAAGLMVAAQKKTAAGWMATRGLQLPKVTQAIRRSGTVNISPDSPAVKPFLEQATSSTRGTYSPDSKTIALLQRADLSTFLHETGHFYLDVLADVASQPGAPAEIVDDMQTVLDWVGVPDVATWRGMTLDQQREAHEQFARGFEAYLFEGNAPSVALQGAFSRFRAWLMTVYQSLTRLNVELTPEVRGVFNRMIATNDEIADAAKRRAMAPLFSTFEESGMTPDEWAAYQSTGTVAAQDALADLQRRSLRDMRWMTGAKGRELKRLQAEAKDVRDQVEAQAQLEVEQQPEYAVQIATKAAPADQKINVEAVREMYADSGLDTSALPRDMLSPEGVHPDLIAEQYGFSSGDHMIRAVLNAQPMEATVQALTDRRMLENHSELSTPQEIDRAADAAVHNAARIRFVATELKALAAMVSHRERTAAGGSIDMILAAAKDYAEQIVARTRVRDLMPSRFSAAGAKSARLAEAARAKGDIQAAAAAKRNQLLAERTSRAMTDARDEARKAVDYLRKFDSDSVRKVIAPQFADQIDQILESVELKQRTNKSLDSRQSLREWIAAQEANGITPVVDPDLLDGLARTNTRDMTMEQLRGLVDAVKNIEHIGRRWQRVVTDREERLFSDAVDQAEASIREHATKTIEQKHETRLPRDRFGKFVSKFFVSHRKLASLIRQMDGGHDDGVLWNLLVRPMNERAAQEATANDQANTALRALFAPMLKLKGGLTKSAQFIPAINTSLTRAGRLSVALNWGNATNRQRVLAGNRWTEQQAQAVMATLTREEWQFVQGTWDYLNSFWPQIVAKERRVTGLTPEKVEASPFTVTTADGHEMEMSGGYYPIKYDPDKSSKAESHDAAQTAKDLLAGAFARATTRRGHTKQRAEEVGRAVRSDLGVIFEHVTQVVHDLAWHEWLIDANRLLGNGQIDAAIKDHYGVEVLRTLKESPIAIAGGDLQAQGATMAVLNKMRANVSAATMGWSMTTALMQPFGLTQSMVRIGPKWVLKGMGRWAGDAAKMENTASWIRDQSEFMRLRAKTMNKEIAEAQNKITAEKPAWQQVYETSLFILMQKMQAVADVPTWVGAYEKAIDGGADQEKAVALADQAVIDAQGSGRTADQASIERDPAGKFLTMFYSYFNTTWNLMAESTARLDAKSLRSWAGWVADMALLTAIPAIGPSLVLAALKGDLPKDDEDWIKKLSQWGLGYLLGLFVIGREAGSLLQGYDYSGPAALRLFADLGKAGKQVWQGELDMPLVDAGVRLLGSAAGLPAAQVQRSYKGWMAWQNGDAPVTSVIFGPPPKN